MYAVEPVESIIQNSTKNCIQEFLKTGKRYTRYSQRNIGHFSGGFLIEPKVSDLHIRISSSYNKFYSQKSAPSDDVHVKDFNYSQKLFHIADGNLYSIFSPKRGRSYGMKPSFLRKQKYTVQESNGKGRKSLRKGLKFHNFLPSESVTSEKDNGILKTKWKVHSECRLREEHGTKQITISNWSQNVRNSEDDKLFRRPTSNCSSSSCLVIANCEEKVKIENELTYENNSWDFKLNNQKKNELENHLKESATIKVEKQDCVKPVNSKKSSLTFVLNSLLDKPIVAKNNVCDPVEAHDKSNSQKHRRKPIQTRRVVPYTKYLSIIEDETSPLDLSSKCSGEIYNDLKFSKEQKSIILRKNKSNCDVLGSFMDTNKVRNFDKGLNSDSVSNSKFSISGSKSEIYMNPSLTHLLHNKIVSPLLLLPSPINSALNIRPTVSGDKRKNLNSHEITDEKYNFNNSQSKSSNPYHDPQVRPQSSFTNNIQYSVHKSFVKNSEQKTRRRSHRSVIKKNLEDTFKQNGFLVKTKQVSDGEATFCKFRQLRKYTRYYLKSWQQHLPAEVHKMWKGFLPPKTVLPSVSNVTEVTNGVS